MKRIRRYRWLVLLAIVTQSCEKTTDDSQPYGFNYGKINVDLSLWNNDYLDACADTVILDAGVEDASYLWSPGGETTQTILLDSLYYHQEYTVQITKFGVTSFDSITLRAAGGLYIPNSFSPNGDGVNDLFYVYGSCFEQFYFVIYNNLNTKKIFESNDQNFGWDGTHSGGFMPAGEYPYRLEVTLFTGQSLKRKGTIQLLR